jgi:hypothetical protein
MMSLSVVSDAIVGIRIAWIIAGDAGSVPVRDRGEVAIIPIADRLNASNCPVPNCCIKKRKGLFLFRLQDIPKNLRHEEGGM